MILQKGRFRIRQGLAFAIVVCLAAVGQLYITGPEVNAGQVAAATLSLLDRYGLGECRHVLAYGDYVIFGSSSGVTLFDVRDPSTPKPIGRVFLANEVRDLAISENRVYVANGNTGLVIIDISDPASPRIVGKHKTPGGTVTIPEEEDGAALCVSLLGKYAVVGIRNNGLQVIDVSSPEHPVPVGRYSSYEDIYQLRICGNLAYAASNKLPGLKVFDLSDPAKPRLESETDVQAWAVSICQEADRLYVFQSKQLSIYDLKTADHPKWIRDISLTTNSLVHDGVVSGGVAYAVGSIGLRVLDLHDVDNPRELLSKSFGLCMAVSTAARYLYLGTWDALHIIDLSNLPAIQVSGEFFGRIFSAGIAAEGDRLYLATTMQNEVRLLTLNVADPNLPQELADLKLDTDRSASLRHVGIHAGRLYILIGRGIIVFDLADRDRPRLLGKWQSRGFLTDGCFQDKYLLVTTEGQNLEILDNTRPDEIQTIGSFRLPGWGIAIRAVQNYAFVLIKDHGLMVLDIKEPARPSSVADLPMKINMTGGLATIGPQDLLCVAGADALRTIDISNPAYPRILGSYSSTGFYDSREISVAGSEACVIANRGAFLFDLSDPNHPSIKGQFPLPVPAMGIAFLRNTIYITTQSDLCILRSR